MAAANTIGEASPFSEKAFYLQEFRGRTLGITIPDRRCAEHPELRRVLAELRDNATRVVLITPADLDGASLGYETLLEDAPQLRSKVWRAFKRCPCVVVRAREDLASASRRTAGDLRLFKLVRLAARSTVHDHAGRSKSFVARAELAELLAASDPDSAQHRLLAEVDALLQVGLPNVNVCRVEVLGDELFTYAGSGTLFTAERYVVVRRLGIEDHDAAADLIARGTGEGFLAPRTDEQVDALLADGLGAFVNDQHLAGIGALRIPEGECAGEVASLYTLTRFAGGGVGADLVGFAQEQASKLGLAFIYACTTFDRVGTFFERQGFRRVEPDEIPAEKWQGYDATRRARVLCYRRDL